VTTGIGNAVGVRRTETALIVWTGTEVAAAVQRQAAAADPRNAPFAADQFYDAGDKGCGEGPLETIAGIVRKMRSGETLAIHATDPSVAVDLAAWTRMGGHELLDQQGTYYLVRRK
jgi:TusA-related sulfurtransferase